MHAIKDEITTTQTYTFQKIMKKGSAKRDKSKRRKNENVVVKKFGSHSVSAGFKLQFNSQFQKFLNCVLIYN